MKPSLRSTFTTRQYMRTHDLEAFYYSDLHFETLPEHRHDNYEFYFFLEGNLDMKIGEQTRRMRPGDVAVVPPGVPHHALIRDPEVPYRRFVLWLGQEKAAGLNALSQEYAFLMQKAVAEDRYFYYYYTVERNAVQSRMLHLLDELHADRYGREAAAELALRDLLLYMSRVIYEREHPCRTDSGDLLQDLTLFIDGHLSEDLSLDTLAEHFYLSKYYLSHYFRDALGIPLHQYILKKRLQGCSEALAAGEDITKTFTGYGFHDYSAFYRAFRREYGMSPKEYRDMYRGSGIPQPKEEE